MLIEPHSWQTAKHSSDPFSKHGIWIAMMTVYKCCFLSHKSLLIAILCIRRLWIPVFLSSFFPLFFFLGWGVIEWFGQEGPAHNESSHNRRDLCKLHLAWGSYKLASSILAVMSTEWSSPRSAKPGKCVPPRPGRFHYLASVHMAHAERKRRRERRRRQASLWLGSDFGRGLFVNIRSGKKARKWRRLKFAASPPSPCLKITMFMRYMEALLF